MTAGDERDFDFAERLAERERETAIAQARRALATDGSDECRDCGEEIDAARRDAVPSAIRCTVCQRRFEADMRKRR